MVTNFLRIADFLQDELQQFFRVVRQTADTATRQAAAARLQAVVNKVETFSYAPGEEQWSATSEPQRWGYLRLESYLGTAQHELHQLRHAVGEVKDSRLASSGPRDEARYA